MSEGLAGKTELDQARVDMIVDCLEDVGKIYRSIVYAESDEKKVIKVLRFGCRSYAVTPFCFVLTSFSG